MEQLLMEFSQNFSAIDMQVQLSTGLRELTKHFLHGTRDVLNGRLITAMCRAGLDHLPLLTCASSADPSTSVASHDIESSTTPQILGEKMKKS